jgi:hypothetical protein
VIKGIKELRVVICVWTYSCPTNEREMDDVELD